MEIEKLFKEVPEVNPKTNKPVATFVCRECGSIVVSRKAHYSWHKRIETPPSIWPGIDDIE